MPIRKPLSNQILKIFTVIIFLTIISSIFAIPYSNEDNEDRDEKKNDDDLTSLSLDEKVEEKSKTFTDSTSSRQEEQSDGWIDKLTLGVREEMNTPSKLISVMVVTTDLGTLHQKLRGYGGVIHTDSDAVKPEHFDYSALSYQQSNGIVMSREIDVPVSSIKDIAELSEVIKILKKPEIHTMSSDVTFNRPQQDVGAQPYGTLNKSLLKIHNADKVWENEIYGDDTNIAIVDTGTDFSHADLIDQWAVAPEGDYSGAGWPLMLDPGSMDLYTTRNQTGVNHTVEGGYPVGFEDSSSSQYSQTNFTFSPTTQPVNVDNETIVYRYDEVLPKSQDDYEASKAHIDLKGDGLYLEEKTHVVKPTERITAGDYVDKSSDNVEDLLKNKETSTGPSTTVENDGWYTLSSTGDWGKYSSLAVDTDDNIHVAFYDEEEHVLMYAFKDVDTWSYDVVDNGTDVGKYCSLALKPNGKPAVSYYDAFNQDIKYAVKNGDGWEVERIDHSVNDRDAGKYSSLAIDSTGKAIISFYESQQDMAWYAKGEFGSFSLRGLSKGSGEGGTHTSVAVDSNNDIHFSYVNKSDNLLYAKWDGSWTRSTIDDSGGVGEYCSIKIDSSNNPHVSYYDGDNGDLKYAYYSSGSWTTTPLDSDGDVGKYTSIALDNNDNPYISYYDVTNGDLKIMFFDVIWYERIVDESGDVGSYTSIDFNSEYTPVISYYFTDNMFLKIASVEPTEINIENIGDEKGKDMCVGGFQTGSKEGFVKDLYLDIAYSVNTDNGDPNLWNENSILLVHGDKKTSALDISPSDGETYVQKTIPITEIANINYLSNISKLNIFYDFNYSGPAPGPTVSFDHIDIICDYHAYPKLHLKKYIKNETGLVRPDNTILSRTVTDPSSLTPSDGDSYIVPVNAVGEWEGQSNKIAEWDSSKHEWEFSTPSEDGFEVWVEDEHIQLDWNSEDVKWLLNDFNLRYVPDYKLSGRFEVYNKSNQTYFYANNNQYLTLFEGDETDQVNSTYNFTQHHLVDVEIFFVNKNGRRFEWNEDNYTLDTFNGSIRLDTDIPPGTFVKSNYEWFYPMGGMSLKEVAFEGRDKNDRFRIYDINKMFIKNVQVYYRNNEREPYIILPEEDYKINHEEGNITLLTNIPEGSMVAIDYEWHYLSGGRKGDEKVVTGNKSDETNTVYDLERYPLLNESAYLEYEDGTINEIDQKDNYTLDYQNGTLTLLMDIPDEANFNISYDWYFFGFDEQFELNTTTGVFTNKYNIKDNTELTFTYECYRRWGENRYSTFEKKGSLQLFDKIEMNEELLASYTCGKGLVTLDVEIPKAQYASNETYGQEYLSGAYNITDLPFKSQSGWYRFGISKSMHLADIWNQQVGMLLVDSEVPGVYDQVFVDIDNDYDFGDEKPVNKSSPLAFTEVKSYNGREGSPMRYIHNYDLAWMGNKAEDANIVLSAGLLYWISDGVNTLPYGERYAEHFEYEEENIPVPKQGNLVAFYDDWGTHGTSTASMAVGTGSSYPVNYLKNSFGEQIADLYSDINSQGFAPNSKVMGVSLLGPAGGSAEAGWLFAAEGYDGIPDTGDEADINSNSWGSFVDNSGWFVYDRLAMNITEMYPHTTLVASAGNQGNGYGTIGSPGSSPAVITVGAGTNMAYKDYMGNDLGFLYPGGESLYQFGIGEGDPMNARPHGDIVSFSSLGPTKMGQPGIDVYAAGAFGMAALPINEPFTYAYEHESGQLDGAIPDGWFLWQQTMKQDRPLPHNNSHTFALFSGTSMAAPITAGVCALVHQVYESKHGSPPTNDEMKRIIMSSADDYGYDVLQQGGGWLNASRAVEMANQSAGVMPGLDFWAPGSYDGISRRGMVNLMKPNESDDIHVELDNYGSHDISNSDGISSETIIEKGKKHKYGENIILSEKGISRESIDLIHTLWLENNSAVIGPQGENSSSILEYLPSYNITDDPLIYNTGDVTDELLFSGNESDETGQYHEFYQHNMTYVDVYKSGKIENETILIGDSGNNVGDSNMLNERGIVSSSVYNSGRIENETVFIGTDINETGYTYNFAERNLYDVTVLYDDSNTKTIWDVDNYSFDYERGVITSETDIPKGAYVNVTYSWDYKMRNNYYEIDKETGKFTLEVDVGDGALVNVTYNWKYLMEESPSNYTVDYLNGNITLNTDIDNGTDLTANWGWHYLWDTSNYHFDHDTGELIVIPSIDFNTKIKATYSVVGLLPENDCLINPLSGDLTLSRSFNHDKPDITEKVVMEYAHNGVSAVTYEKTMEFSFDFNWDLMDGYITVTKDGVFKGNTAGNWEKVVSDDGDNTLSRILNQTGFLKVTAIMEKTSNSYIQIYDWQDVNETIFGKEPTSKGENGIYDGRDEKVRFTWAMDKSQYLTAVVRDPKNRVHDGLVLESKVAGMQAEGEGTIVLESYQKEEWDWIDISNVSNDGFDAKITVPEDAGVGGYQGAFVYDCGQQSSFGVIPIFVNVAGYPSRANGSLEIGGEYANHGLYSNDRIGAHVAYYDSRIFYLDYELLFPPAENDHYMAIIQHLSNQSTMEIKAYGESFSPYSGGDFGPFSMSMISESPASTDPYKTMIQVEDYLRRNPDGLVLLEIRCIGVGSEGPMGELINGTLGHMKVWPTDTTRYNEPRGKMNINVETSFDIDGGISVLAPDSEEESGTDSVSSHDIAPYGSDFVKYLAEAPDMQEVELPEGVYTFNFHIWGLSDSDDYDLGLFYVIPDDYDGSMENVLEIEHPPGSGKNIEVKFMEYCADADADEDVTLITPEQGTYLCKVAGFTVSSGEYDYHWKYYSEGEALYEIQDLSNKTVRPKSNETDLKFNLTWDMPVNIVNKTVESKVFLSPTASSVALTEIITPSVIFDYQKPVLEDVSPGDQEILNSRDVAISASYEDKGKSGIDIDNIVLYLDNEKQVVNPTEEHVSLTTEDLSDGVHDVMLIVTDKAGNEVVKEWSFVVDTTDPLIDISHPADSEITTRNDMYEIQGTVDDNDAIVVINDDRVPLSGGSFKHEVSINEGENKFTIVAEDEAGNKYEVIREIIHDTSDPVLRGASPLSTNIVTNKDQITFKGQIHGEKFLYNNKVMINDNEVKVTADGSFYYIYELFEGENVITREIIDAAGNRVSDTFYITRDTELIDFKVDDIEKIDDGTVLVSGTVEDDSSVSINGIPVKVQQGQYSSEIDIIPGRSNEIIVYAEDEAGNSEQITRTYESVSSSSKKTSSISDHLGYLIGISIGALIVGLIIGLFSIKFLGGGFKKETEGDEQQEELETDEIEDMGEPVDEGEEISDEEEKVSIDDSGADDDLIEEEEVSDNKETTVEDPEELGDEQEENLSE
ncbi:MAG: S8 family serine peptidase [Thermoplasmata archaeon]